LNAAIKYIVLMLTHDAVIFHVLLLSICYDKICLFFNIAFVSFRLPLSLHRTARRQVYYMYPGCGAAVPHGV